MPLVQTDPQKCRDCRRCVRECPVKALRAEDGHISTVAELCIACGSCVRACRWGARRYRDSTPAAREVLRGDGKAVAVLAPSLVAGLDFSEPGAIVSALRELGFTRVIEAAHGAELARAACRDVLASDGVRTPALTSFCPACVNLVEMHYPDLIPHLLPVVSPAVAAARYLRSQARHDREAQPHIVFIGPCVAMKGLESGSGSCIQGDIDVVLTPGEVQRMFAARGIDLEGDSELDPPYPSSGRIAAIPGGFWGGIGPDCDTLSSDTVVVDGRNRVMELVSTLERDAVRAGCVEIAFCEGGCMSGPAMNTDQSMMQRREALIAYALDDAATDVQGGYAPAASALTSEDLARAFARRYHGLETPSEGQIRAILAELTTEEELDCGACGYSGCRDRAIAVYRGFARPEICPRRRMDRPGGQVDQEQDAGERPGMVDTISALGTIAASVIHEINNPLQGVLLHAQLLHTEDVSEEMGELVDAVMTGASRCREILRGALDYARLPRLRRRRVRLEQYLGDLISQMRSCMPEGVGIRGEQLFASSPVLLDAEQMERVLSNIIDNAVEAVDGRGEITVSVDQDRAENVVSITVSDDGAGIADEELRSLFVPFYTTKTDGRGMGLGLTVAQGIVRMHGGRIEVESSPGEGTRVTITLPSESTP